MTDKELLGAIGEQTEHLHRLYLTTNPFSLPNEVRPIYQEMADDVRKLNSNVQVALRNYDKLLAFYHARIAEEADVAMFDSKEFANA